MDKTVFSPFCVKWKYFYLAQNIVIRDLIFCNSVEESIFLQLLQISSLCLYNYMLKSFILSSDPLFFKATLTVDPEILSEARHKSQRDIHNLICNMC